jgi:hypothetical protein
LTSNASNKNRSLTQPPSVCHKLPAPPPLPPFPWPNEILLTLILHPRPGPPEENPNPFRFALQKIEEEERWYGEASSQSYALTGEVTWNGADTTWDVTYNYDNQSGDSAANGWSHVKAVFDLPVTIGPLDLRDEPANRDVTSRVNQQ